jgi:hypothetical protein
MTRQETKTIKVIKTFNITINDLSSLGQMGDRLAYLRNTNSSDKVRSELVRFAIRRLAADPRALEELAESPQ